MCFSAALKSGGVPEKHRHLLLHSCSEAPRPAHGETAHPELGIAQAGVWPDPPLPSLNSASFVLTDADMRFWCPSLQEVKEVFHSLGAYNPALYPHGPFQHSTRCVAAHPRYCLLPSSRVTLAYRVGLLRRHPYLPVRTSVAPQTVWPSGPRAQGCLDSRGGSVLSLTQTLPPPTAGSQTSPSS